MGKIEPIVIDILFENGGVILEDYFVQRLSEEIKDLEKEKIEKAIKKLINKNKIYRLEEKYISLTDFGDLQEDKIDDLLSKLVPSRFLFKNPKIRNVNGEEKEFCDNMIFFDETLIIIQSKTKDYTKLEQFERFKKKSILKSIQQLETSIRWCKNNQVKKIFKNNLGEEIELNNLNIKKIIGMNICYFHQDRDFYISKSWQDNLKNLEDIPNILTYEELKKIIQLNDTIPDFLEYIDKRRILVQSEIPFLSEYQILGYFFYTNRTMEFEDLKTSELKSSLVILDEGFESDLDKGELKKKLDIRKKNNENSYFVDKIINKTIKNIQGEKYIFYIELLKLTRFQRRLIANRVLPIYKEFITKNQVSREPFITLDEKTGVLFVFSRKNWDYNKYHESIRLNSLIMKVKHKLEKIIVITENHFNNGEANHTFCVIESTNLEDDKKQIPVEYHHLIEDRSNVKKLDTVYEFD